MKIVVSFSGGVDSTTLCSYYLDQGHDVALVSFNYGSKHNEFENAAASNIAKYFELPLPKHLPLNFIHDLFKSDLLVSGGDIPEGHYTDKSMSSTVVPARNLIFSSILAGYAESIGADAIALGVHSGDHHIYPDCRPDFIKSLVTTTKLATDGKVHVDAPFLHYSKADILRVGLSLKNISVPYHMTRTCYKNQPTACGKCGSCVERLEAFRLVGTPDPIEYEYDGNI